MNSISRPTTKQPGSAQAQHHSYRTKLLLIHRRDARLHLPRRRRAQPHGEAAAAPARDDELVCTEGGGRWGGWEIQKDGQVRKRGWTEQEQA